MRWDRCLVGVALLALVVGASYWSKRSVLSFENLEDVKSTLRGQGYYFTSDSTNGTPSIGFLVSREAQEPGQLGSLCKVGVMGPAWKGKIWVTRSSDDWQLLSTPDDAETRVWGNVIAFGDGDLLAELEETLAWSTTP